MHIGKLHKQREAKQRL